MESDRIVLFAAIIALALLCNALLIHAAATNSSENQSNASALGSIAAPKFSAGDNVTTRYPTTLWKTPTNAIYNGSVPIGTYGTISAEPVYDNNTLIWFYDVSFSTGKSGWVKEKEIVISNHTTTHNVNSLTVNITASDNPIDVGQTIFIEAKATNGIGPYNISIQEDGNIVATTIKCANGTLGFDFTPSAPGNYKFAAMAADSSSPVENATSNLLIVGVENHTETISAANSTIQLGQSDLITANIGITLNGTTHFENGNTSLYFEYSNGTIANTLFQSAQAGTYGYNFMPTKVGTYSFNVVFNDSDSPPQSIYFNSTRVAVVVTPSSSPSHPTLTISPSNASIDTGQLELYTLRVNGGVGPFDVELFNVTGNSQQGGNVIIASAGGSNTIGFTAGAGGIFTYNGVATDTASSNTFSSGSNAITVNAGNTSSNAVPTVSLTPSGPVLNQSESETYTIKVNGGTGPFTVELFNSTGSTQQGSNVLINFPGGSNTITFTTGATGTFTYQALATDMGTSSPFTFASAPNTITVNSNSIITSNALSITSLLASNASVPIGQITNISGTINGGIAPYTYNFVITSKDGSIIGNFLDANVASKLDSFIFRPKFTTGALTVNLTVTDNSPVPQKVSKSIGINVRSASADNSAFLTLTASSPVVDAGQLEIFTVSANGGVGPFDVELFNLTGGLQQGSNVIIETPGGSNTISFVAGSLGNFTYNAIATDSGASNFVFVSASSTIKVNGNANNTNGGNSPTLTISSSSNSLLSGQNVTFTVNEIGGTGPFTVELFNVTGNSQQGGNVVILTPGSGNSITFTTSSVGTFTYIGIATDKGTSAPFVFESQKSTITVNASSASTTTTISNGGGGGGGGIISSGGSGNPSAYNPLTVTTSADGCISAQNVQVPDSYNFSLAGSSFTVIDDYIGSNYTNVTINGAAEKLPMDVPTSIAGLQIYMELTGIVQIGSFHAVSLMACQSSPVSNSTIALNISFNTSKLAITSVKPPSYINLVRLMNASSVPRLPSNYTGLFVTSVNVSSNAVKSINFAVNFSLKSGCGINNVSLIHPFTLSSGAWSPVEPFRLDSTSCSVLFATSSNPTIGLFYQTRPVTPLNPSLVPPKPRQTATAQAYNVIKSTPGTRYNSLWLLIGLTIIVIVIALAYLQYRGGQTTHNSPAPIESEPASQITKEESE